MLLRSNVVWMLGCCGLLVVGSSEGVAQAAPSPAKARTVTAAVKARPKPTQKAKAKGKKKLSAYDKEKASLRLWRDRLAKELNRYWAMFQKRKPPRVYYAMFAMQRARNVMVAARDGVILRTSDQRKNPRHKLFVSLRVGSHKLDSTGQEGYDWKAFKNFLTVRGNLTSKPTLPMLRKLLWKMTDSKFKRSMARYHRKRYVRSLKVEVKDKSGDFSKEDAVFLEQFPPTLTFNKKKWSDIARRVSRFSLKNLRVVRSGITISASQDIRIMVDSNGTRIIRHKTLYRYSIQIAYLSPKKNELLSNYRLAYYDTESKLPNEKQLVQLVKQTMKELVNQGNAPEGDPVEAPAILLPDVAGVLFHEALGHRLEAQRFVKESDGRTFRRKLGKKVIPRFLSLLDDPTLEQWGDTPLNGHYLVDDQGVLSRRVTLIKDGILRGFLMSRKPVDKIKHSSGHGRAFFGRTPVSRMGTLRVVSKREFPMKTLRKMLIAEAKRQGKPYAFIINRASGGYTHTGTYAIQSFKNRPKVVIRIDVKTGKETFVKGLEIIGTPLTVVNNIMATGSDYGVFNGYCGAESGWVPVSAIAPSLLLKTVELQRIRIAQKKFYQLTPPAGLGSPTKKITKKTAAEPTKTVGKKTTAVAKPGKAAKVVAKKAAVAKPVKAAKAAKVVAKKPVVRRVVPVPARPAPRSR